MPSQRCMHFSSSTSRCGRSSCRSSAALRSLWTSEWRWTRCGLTRPSLREGALPKLNLGKRGSAAFGCCREILLMSYNYETCFKAKFGKISQAKNVWQISNWKEEAYRKKESVAGTHVTLGPSTGGCGRRVLDQIVDQGGQKSIKTDKNLIVSSGGRIRSGSDGRSRCPRWSGVEWERQVVAREGTTMMDTGDLKQQSHPFDIGSWANW